MNKRKYNRIVIVPCTFTEGTVVRLKCYCKRYHVSKSNLFKLCFLYMDYISTDEITPISFDTFVDFMKH